MLELVSTAACSGPGIPVVKRGAQAAEETATETAVSREAPAAKSLWLTGLLQHDSLTKDCWKMHMPGPTPSKVPVG